jgi:hypothetical protein
VYCGALAASVMTGLVAISPDIEDLRTWRENNYAPQMHTDPHSDKDRPVR